MNFQHTNTLEVSLTAQSYTQLIEQDIQEIQSWPLEERNRSRFDKLKSNNYTVLDNSDAIAFNAAFGNMHIVKLTKALTGALNCKLLKQASIAEAGSINIYDWGAGQGLATAITLDFLSKNNMLNVPIHVHLIEPSPIATQRAELLIKNMQSPLGANEIQVSIYNIDLDLEAERNEVPILKKGFTIHLFSNVLDLLKDVKGLCEQINNHSNQDSLFICVGPVTTGMYTVKQAFNVQQNLQSEKLVANTYSYTQAMVNFRTVDSHSLTFLLKK